MSNNCETLRPPRHPALAGAKLDFRVYTAPIHPPTRQYTPPPGLNHPVQASLYWHYPRIVTNGLFPHNAPVRFSLLHPSSLSASIPSVSTSFSLSVVAHLILVRFASTGKLYFSKLFLLAFSQCDWATLDLVILLKHFESTELCSRLLSVASLVPATEVSFLNSPTLLHSFLDISLDRTFMSFN